MNFCPYCYQPYTEIDCPSCRGQKIYDLLPSKTVGHIGKHSIYNDLRGLREKDLSIECMVVVRGMNVGDVQKFGNRKIQRVR
jgi:hypothetical protein